MTVGKLVIRADAAPDIGTGHVMRMLALAQAWQDRFEEQVVDDHGPLVQFICALLPEAFEERLLLEGCEVVRISVTPGSADDVTQTLAAAKAVMKNPKPGASAPWMVVDGYHFDLAYQRAIRADNFKLLVVDDYNHLPEYECDILLNQNIGADKYEYRVNSDAQKLLGPRYALLRREFREALGRISGKPGEGCDVPENAKHILVTMGGADLHNVSLKVIEALNQSEIEGLEVKIVVGASNKHRADLQNAIQSPGFLNTKMRVIQSADMSSLMQWADMAITAAGSTCWELMAMGVPMVTVVLAENQEQVGHLLDQYDIAINLGWYHAWSKTECADMVKDLTCHHTLRARMVEMGRNLVDCEGARRVAMALENSVLSLRPATINDARKIWEWTNDPETRSASFSSDLIAWETHLAWMHDVLSDFRVRIYLAEVCGEAVGVVRFEAADNESNFISLALAPCARGRGLGSKLVEKGAEMIARETGRYSIHAYVKPANRRSCRIFDRAGFKALPDTTVKGQPAKHYYLMMTP
jgi:UDP-2,4-diacetamido-2,4,6-trideoxy-beta-L-altropyranose hydrolase